MIDHVGSDSCVLCGNCAIICPVKAIKFTYDYNNFLYPEIEREKCILCHKCDQVCPAINIPLKRNLVESYAGNNKDDYILKNSTSGGIFTELALAILRDGGIVYGAAYQDDLSVAHVAVTEKEDLQLLRGSKYVQSDLNVCFPQIKEQLREGREILFVGTPCQCAALRAFIHEDYDKLFIVDFICHSILSAKLFKEYIQFMEKKRRSKIVNINFRDKSKYGWEIPCVKITYENGKIDSWPYYDDLYMKGSLHNICSKEACYKCKYKNFQSGSDITLGDFWGVRDLLPEYMDERGVSIVCIQSDNGVRLLNKAKNNLLLRKTSLEILTRFNKGLIQPFSKSENSEKFYELAKRYGNIKALKILEKKSLYKRILDIYRRMRLKKRSKNWLKNAKMQ